MLYGHNAGRLLARTGVEWICVDCEHGLNDDQGMHQAVPAIAATGVSPIVRIPGKDDWMVKRALDAGAHGIVCPLLRSVQDCKDFVAACKFPPKGGRGFGSVFPLEAFRTEKGVPPNPLEYLTQANDTILTIVQIETKEALDNVEEIAAIDGLDVLFIGPFDLGNNIGRPAMPQMHEELKAAVEKIRTSAKKAGKFSAIYAVNGQQAQQFAAQGFDMINVATDAASLSEHVANQLKVAKGGN